MRPPNVTDEKFAQLRAAYETAWRRYSAVVREWQASETEEAGRGSRASEAAIEAAEKQYREARNALADYTLAHLAPAHRTAVLTIELEEATLEPVGRRSNSKARTQRPCPCC